MVTNLNPKTHQQIAEVTKRETSIRVNMPTNQEVEAFIKSKPNYEHDLRMVQNEFFGRTLSSRGPTKSMYHRTNKQLANVRKKIEKEEGRNFKEQILDQNVKRYRIEPIQQLSIENL
jgi:hypothetical protein